MKTNKPQCYLNEAGLPPVLHPHIDLLLSLCNDCSTWLLIAYWWLHDEKLQNLKICNHEPHKNRELANKIAYPSFMSALFMPHERKSLIHDNHLDISYYLSIGEECPWMWPRFLECNNKYLKCLATVSLINKLFTTPQYIEEKLLVVLLETFFNQPQSPQANSLT